MVGSGRAGLRPGVRPRADQALARARAAPRAGAGSRWCSRPPSRRPRRRRPRFGVVLAHRALLPVGVAALVPQPVVDERRRLAHPLEPHVAPALADDVRVGRPGVPREHRRRPLQHVRADAAAVVVDVVGVAVVGRAQGHDRLQRRRSVGGHLQPVEPAPRDADHADRAGAPRLLGDPGDHLARVGLLLRQVLVLEDAVRLAGAALVDAHAGVAVTGQVGEVARVAHRGAVVQAVGQVLEDRRHRVGAASSGSQIRAARRQPSASVIHVVAIVRTGRGNSVTTRTARFKQAAAARGPARGSRPPREPPR